MQNELKPCPFCGGKVKRIIGYKRNLGTALAALRTEQSRQWISVEDGLPDTCGYKCLVVGINKFGQTEVFTAFTGYMERGKLEFHSCEPTHEIPAWTVTHWMPLPEPPMDCGRRLTEGRESK